MRAVIIKLSIFVFLLPSANALQNKTPQKNTDGIVAQIKLLRDEAAQLNSSDYAQKAITKLENALALYNENNIRNSKLLFGIYVDLSNLYGVESIRNEEKTLAFIKKAKSLAEKADVRNHDLINFYISLASAQLEESKHEEALGYITMAYDTLERKNEQLKTEIGTDSEKRLRANLLEWFVSLNFSLNKEEELIKSHQRLKHFFQLNSTNEDIEYYYALASFRVGRYYQNKNATKAEYYFNISEEKGDKNIKLYSIICKGFAFLAAEEYDKAPILIKKLKEFEGLNKFQELNLHEIATRYYSETKQIEKLIWHTNRGLTLLNAKKIEIDILNFNSEDFNPIKELKYPILLNQFALFLEESNSPKLIETSTELFKIALNQFDSRIDRKPLNNHYVNYDIIRHRNLELLAKPNATLNKKIDILSKIERIDNRAYLNKIILNRALANKKSYLDHLLTKENNIREEITLLKQKQIESDTIMSQKLFELDLQLKELNLQLIEENPTLHGLSTTQFDLSSIHLDTGTKLFKFLKTEDRLFRITISNSDITVKDLGNYESIEKNVLLYLDKIKVYNRKEDHKKISTDLYNQLLDDERIAEKTIIITDACLNYFPFELLTKNDGYLLENTAISYTQSLMFFNSTLNKPNIYDENITLFAPSYSTFKPSEIQLAVRGEPYDLKGAIEEVDVINDIMGGVVFRNENASKSQFLNMPNNSAIIHLAGHAFLNDKDPELSSIIFSDNETDNQLFISELYGFKSNAELAVLSACNTGVGGYKNGNSVTSLSQAFIYSGIPATLSSLWSAPDISTKEIMISFYKYLNTGMSKSEALRHAKLSYLNKNSDSKLKHPYYWAGFVLYGNDKPIVLNKDSNIKKHLLLCAILAGCIGIFFWFRKSRVK